MHLQDSPVSLPTLKEALDIFPLRVKPETLLGEVLALMEQVSSSPVLAGIPRQQGDYVLVMEEATLLGIFTERDLVRLTASGWVASHPVTIAEVMRQPLVTLTFSENQDIIIALDLLRQHQIRHLPVVDAQDQLLGIVTQTSILQSILSRGIDIRDRQQTEAALQVSEANFRHIYENSPVMMHSIDESGNFCNVNGQWLEETGYSREEVIGKPASFVMTEESAQRAIAQIIPQFWRDGAVRNIPYQYVRKDGRIIDILLNCDATTDPSGRKISLSVARNVTEQKRAEEALRFGEERFRSLSECSPVGIFVADINGFCTYNNPRFQVISGISCKTGLGEGWRHFIHPEDQERVFAEWLAIAPTNREVSLEFRFLHQDGSIRWVCVRTSPMFADTGKISGYVGTLEDITTRKQAESALQKLNQQLEIRVQERTSKLEETVMALEAEISQRQLAEAALRESEERYRWMADNSTDMISRHTPEGIYLYASSACRLILGYEPEELLGHLAYDFFYPEDFAVIQQTHALILKQSDTYTVTYRIRHKDGRYIWLESTGKSIYNLDSATVQEIIIVSRDVTQRKQAEEALRQSELRLRIALNAAQMGTWDWNIATNQVRWSDRTELIFGLKIGSFSGRFEALLSMIHVEDRTYFTEQISHALTQEINYEVEVRIYRSDGTIRWIASIGDVLRDSTGKPLGMAGVVMDITERKQVEQALKESEEKFRRVFEDAPIGMMLNEANGKGMQMNPAFCKMLGYTEAELTQLTFEQLTHPEDLSIEIPYIERCFQGEITNYQMEKRYIQKNGEILWANLTAGIIRDEKGNLRYGLGMVEDITERRRVEESLRLRDRAIAASRNGITIADARVPDLPMTYVNPAFERMTGYCAEEVLGRNCRFLQNDESHQAELNKLRTAIREQNDCTVVLRNYRKDGTIFWNELSVSPIYDSEGTLTHFIGIQTDITERKQAEDALQHAKDQLQAVLDAVPGFVAWVDSELRYEGVNRYLANTFNLSPEVFVGQKLGFHQHSSELTTFMRQFLDSPASAANQVIEVQVEGSIQNYLLVAQKYQKGRAAVLVGIDISDRQRVEEQIKSSLAEKEVLLKEIHHRVKNNLQIISSLLKLQSGYIHDEKALALFTDSYNRVRSMALIHENLYQSLDLAKIQLANYIKTLTTNLSQSYQLSSSVKLQVEVAEIWLDIDTAIPCGLIINELVSNSFKYAFKETTSGIVRIQVMEDLSNNIQLEISDNGSGLPADFEVKNLNSLGLKLVWNLTKQLQGSLELNTANGTAFTIRFQRKTKLK